MDTKINLLKQLLALYKQLFDLLSKKEPIDVLKERLGFYESSGNYKCVNSLGYLGKYQFGMARLSDIGYTELKKGKTGYYQSDYDWKSGYSKEIFLNTPAVQEQAFLRHFENWKKYILVNYSEILGTVRYGVKINIATLFLALHFAGPKGLRLFLDYGSDSADAYGNGLKSYMKKFEDIEI